MNDFKLCIDFLFNFFAQLFSLCKDYWLLSIIILFGVFSIIISLFSLIRGNS